MLASPPVRLAGERVEAPLPALAAAVLAFCALFFGGGLSDAPLVWIGGPARPLSAAPPLLPSPPRGPGAGRPPLLADPPGRHGRGLPRLPQRTGALVRSDDGLVGLAGRLVGLHEPNARLCRLRPPRRARRRGTVRARCGRGDSAGGPAPRLGAPGEMRPGALLRLRADRSPARAARRLEHARARLRRGRPARPVARLARARRERGALVRRRRRAAAHLLALRGRPRVYRGSGVDRAR